MNKLFATVLLSTVLVACSRYEAAHAEFEVTPLQFPVTETPNWGAFLTPKEWNRSFEEFTQDDFVPIPKYDLAVMRRPMKVYTRLMTRKRATPYLTMKMFYSTRFCATYSLDSDEFSGNHCAIDLKLPLNTPFTSISDGFVQEVAMDDTVFGNTVVVFFDNNERSYLVRYAHLKNVSVKAGQLVKTGSLIGTIGMTGTTTQPHLHLEVTDVETKLPVNPMYFFPHLLP